MKLDLREFLSSNKGGSIDISSYSDGSNDAQVMNHAFWINDLLFVVPPEQIIIQSTDSTREWQSLRTNTSAKTMNPGSREIFSIRLIIPSKSSIVNVDTRIQLPGSVTVGDNTGKRGGFLDLLIQFQNIPFAKVENAVIRSKLRLPKDKNVVMALAQMAVSTVDGLPDTLQVMLDMWPLNYSPYSDRWLYKEDWISKEAYGRKRFTDVNPINLPGRDPYKVLFSQAAEAYAYSTNEWVAYEKEIGMSVPRPGPTVEDLTAPPIISNSDDVTSHSYNIDFTENTEAMWDTDRNFMENPYAVYNPSESAVFKDYVDWLHYKRTAYDGGDGVIRDLTTISPYGSDTQNLGNTVKFKWREYTRFPIPSDLENRIRIHIRNQLIGHELGNLDTEQAANASVANQVANPLRTEPLRQGQDYAVWAVPFDNPWWISAFMRKRTAPVNGTANRYLDGNTMRYHWGIDIIPRNPRTQFLDQGGSGIGTAITSIVPGRITDITRVPFDHIDRSDRVERDGDLYQGFAIIPGYSTGDDPHTYFFDVRQPEETQGEDYGRGNSVTVLVGDSHPLRGYRVRYFHMANINPMLEEGSLVSLDTELGILGGTSVFDDMPHLHLDIVGPDFDPDNGIANISHVIDPTPWIMGKKSVRVEEVNLQQEVIDYYNSLNPASRPVQNASTGVADFDYFSYFTCPPDRMPPDTGLQIAEQVPQAPVDRSTPEREIADAFAATLEKSPSYASWVQGYVDQGWTYYNQDLVILDCFYREHSLELLSGSEAGDYSKVPLVCTHISGTAQNQIVAIPINGCLHPTSQHLGSMDSMHNLSISAVGLNNVKRISGMRDMLKQQAILFKGIPDSWVLEVENNFINAFTTTHAVINGVDVVTVLDQVDLYNIELRLKATKISRTPPRLSYAGNTDIARIRTAFLRDIFGNGRYEDALLRIAYEGQNGNGLKVLKTLEEVTTYVNSEAYQPSDVYVVPRETVVIDGTEIDLSAEARTYLLEVCRSLNLINSLFYHGEGRTKSVTGAGDRQGGLNGIFTFGIGNDFSERVGISPEIINPLFYPINPINSSGWEFIQGDILSPQDEISFFFRAGPRQSSIFGEYSTPQGSIRIQVPMNVDIVRDYRSVRATIDTSNPEENLFVWYGSSNYNIVNGNFSDSFIYPLADNIRDDLDFTTVYQDATSASQASGSHILRPYLYGPPSWAAYTRTIESLISGVWGLCPTYVNVRSGGFPIQPAWFIGNVQEFINSEVSASIARESDFLLIPDDNLDFSDDQNLKLTRVTQRERRNLYGPEDFTRQSVVNWQDYEAVTWSQLGLPYLINCLNPSQSTGIGAVVNMISAQTWMPNSKLATEVAQKKSSFPAYPDLTLPNHPYYSMDPNSEFKNLFTEPDFYLYNAGLEGRAETPFIDGNGNPESDYNRTVTAEAEMAIQSMINLGEIPRRFSGPGNLTTLFEGSDAGVEFEYGWKEEYEPTYQEADRTGPNSNLTYKPYSQSEEGIDAEDEAMVNNKGRSEGAIYNSDVYKREPDTDGTLVNHPFNDGGAIANTGSIGYEQLIGDILSYGMDEPNRRFNNTSPEWLDWRSVVAGFGANTDFATQAPPSIGRVDTAYEYITRRPRQTWNAVIASRDLITEAPYRFNVEEFEPSGTSFIEGNWGANPMSQWSNNRYALYGKIRDALRSVGRKKWAGRRAFPTFKVYFIEEDTTSNGSGRMQWVQYDDLYTYNQVESIEISESRKRPASLCTISFLNTSGLLDGNNMWNAAQGYQGTQGNNSSEDPRTTEEISRRLNSENNIPNSQDTDLEQNMNNFVLQEGVKLKVCLGYSNNPDKLKEMFIGEVVEVVYGDDGNRIQVICQSYGTELVAKIKGGTVREINKLYPDTFNLLASMMFEPEIIHFGRRSMAEVNMIGVGQSIRRNELLYKTVFPGNIVMRFARGIGRGLSWAVESVVPFGTEATNGYVGRDGVERWFIGAAIQRVKDYTQKSMNQIRVEPRTGPNDDNIFAPNFSAEETIGNNVMVLSRWHRFDVNTVPRQGEPVVSVDATPTGIRPGDNDTPGGYPAGTEPSYRYIQRLRRWELEYHTFYSTIWEIFDEMTLRHPGFVKHPRLYGGDNRMTMFFGLPDQYYWASKPSYGEVARSNALFGSMMGESRTESGQVRGPGGTGGVVSAREEVNKLEVRTADFNRWISSITRRFKPFRSWHHVNSTTDIVQNNMVVNNYGFYTSVHVQFVGSRAVSRLRSALNRIEDADPNTILDASGFVRFRDKDVLEMKSHLDLAEQNIRQAFHEYPNCRGRVMAHRYARALLARYAKEMYKGTLTVLGDPEYKPYDVILLSDTYNKVGGPIEIEEVIHSFTPYTGYLCEIVPDTFVIQEDITPYVIMSGIMPTVAVKTERYLEDAIFSRYTDVNPAEYGAAAAIQQTFETEAANLDADAAVIEGALDTLGEFSSQAGGEAAVIGAFYGGRVGSMFSPVGTAVGVVGGAVLGVGVTTAAHFYIQHLIVNHVANRKAFIMIPLLKSGRPWIAGYNLTPTSTYYRGLFDVMRRWWDDGTDGLNLITSDAMASNAKIREFFGSDLTALAQLQLNLDDFGLSVRRGLVRMADGFVGTRRPQ